MILIAPIRSLTCRLVTKMCRGSDNITAQATEKLQRFGADERQVNLYTLFLPLL